MNVSTRTAPPQCRAGWTRHILAGVDSLTPQLAERVTAAIPAELRRQLDDAIAIGWLPLEVHMGVLSALRSTLGRRQYQELCARQISSSLHNPALFAKPARAALRLYGAGPFAMFKGVPPSLRYIFRNAGDLRVQTSDDGQRLTATYENFPPRFSGGDIWSLIWVATIEAIATYAVEGESLQVQVTLTRHEPEQGYFEWHAYTSPPTP